MTTSQIEYGMDHVYPRSTLPEDEDGFKQIMHENLEELIDYESFQVMLTMKEFWDLEACMKADNDFEQLKN